MVDRQKPIPTVGQSWIGCGACLTGGGTKEDQCLFKLGYEVCLKHLVCVSREDRRVRNDVRAGS